MSLLKRIPDGALSAGYFAGFLTCIALLGAAYYFEYALYLEPCPLCIVQRIATLMVGIGCLWAFLGRNTQWPLRLGLLFTSASSVFGAWVANHHVTIQNLPADEVPVCGPGLEYMIETLPPSELITTILKGDGSCADVSWLFLGLTMPQWMLVVFLGFLVVSVIAVVRVWSR